MEKIKAALDKAVAAKEKQVATIERHKKQFAKKVSGYARSVETDNERGMGNGG